MMKAMAWSTVQSVGVNFDTVKKSGDEEYLLGASMAYADLSHAKAPGADFGDADLGSAKLHGLDAPGARWDGAKTGGARREDADLLAAERWEPPPAPPGARP